MVVTQRSQDTDPVQRICPFKGSVSFQVASSCSVFSIWVPLKDKIYYSSRLFPLVKDSVKLPTALQSAGSHGCAPHCSLSSSTSITRLLSEDLEYLQCVWILLGVCSTAACSIQLVCVRWIICSSSGLGLLARLIRALHRNEAREGWDTQV